jgi:hypothetical protein
MQLSGKDDDLDSSTTIFNVTQEGRNEVERRTDDLAPALARSISIDKGIESSVVDDLIAGFEDFSIGRCKSSTIGFAGWLSVPSENFLNPHVTEEQILHVFNDNLCLNVSPRELPRLKFQRSLEPLVITPFKCTSAPEAKPNLMCILRYYYT